MKGLNLPPAPWSYDYAGTLKNKTEVELHKSLSELRASGEKRAGGLLVEESWKIHAIEMELGIRELEACTEILKQEEQRELINEYYGEMRFD